MAELSSADALVSEIGEAPPSSVVMFSGAGISVEGPASLPTGWELTSRVFGGFFAPDTLATVLRHHSAVGWWSPAACDLNPTWLLRLPRLETVLGVVADVYGHEAVSAALADIRDARPNRLHRFFAAHLAEGGRHLTANFDGCVEMAADADYPCWRDRGRVMHFHGSFTSDPSGKSLGATLGQIQGGFSAPVAAEFGEFFLTSGIVIVAGYSGSDFFDVDTAVGAMRPGHLAGLRVIWINHSSHSWHHIDLSGPPLTGHLKRAGAQVEMVCGPTGDLVRVLAARWGLPDPGGPVPRVIRNPALTASADQRRAATFMLYRELGLHAEIASLLRAGPPAGVDPAAVWLARSESLWARGRWGTLRRTWQHGPVPPALGTAMRAERVGACLWVQGRLLPAYLWLTWHRRRCADAADRPMLAETEGRVIEHMARVPELRLLARVLAPGLIRVLGETPQQAGVHLYRRRSDLVSSLRAVIGEPRPAAEADTSRAWFTEAGNLAAALNYRHRQYRDAYTSGAAIDDAELADRYRQLQRHFEGVGSSADAWAAHRLPGAERVFTAREIIRGLIAVQYGWWQRIRLFSRYIILRARHRSGRLRGGQS